MYPCVLGIVSLFLACMCIGFSLNHLGTSWLGPPSSSSLSKNIISAVALFSNKRFTLLRVYCWLRTNSAITLLICPVIHSQYEPLIALVTTIFFPFLQASKGSFDSYSIFLRNIYVSSRGLSDLVLHHLCSLLFIPKPFLSRVFVLYMRTNYLCLIGFLLYFSLSFGDFLSFLFFHFLFGGDGSSIIITNIIIIMQLFFCCV